MCKIDTQNNRGSKWRKWDLQIQPIKDEWFCALHSKIDEIKNATRAYLQEAIKKEISVVAITDHNCGIAIDAAQQIVKEDNLDIVVMPGVEIDVNIGFQLIIIFNPEYKTKIAKQTWMETVEHFLNNVCGLASPVINIHGQAESINGDIHEILSKICKDDIGLPIFAHCQSYKGLFQKTTKARRKEYFTKCLDGKYYFIIDNKTDKNIRDTKNKIRGWGIDINKFAYIKTSDAHHASDVGSSFSWIKADPTYEGLKQIIYDPQSRIAIQDNKPVQPNNVIDSITFNISSNAKIIVKQKDGSEKEENFCFAGANTTYYLSPFFNCFIGGRGTGKSTILNFLGQYSEDPSSSQLFWKKIQPSFDTTDSKIFSFDGVTLFEFIGQSEVESFATDKESFTKAIYERANILSDGALKRNEKKLEKLLKKFQSFQTLVEYIEKLFKEKKLKEKEKTTLENAVKITKSKEYSEIVEDITIKSNQKQKLESWRNTIDELRNSLKELQERHFGTGSNEDVDNIVLTEENEKNKEEENKEYNNIVKGYIRAYKQAKINIVNAAKILNPSNFKDLAQKESSLTKEIEVLEKNLSNLLKKAGLSDENILQVKSAPQKIVRIDDALSKLNKKIKDKQKEISEYNNILKDVKKVRKEYEEVIEKWIKPLAEILKEQSDSNNQKDIKNIGLDYFFDEQEAWRQIANEFYSYFSRQYKYGERSDLLKNFIVGNKNIFIGSHKKIKDFLAKQEKSVGYIKFLKYIFDKQSN